MSPDIVFWQNMPSHHLSGAIRCVADNWPGKVWGVYDLDMLPARKSLGWQIPDVGSTRIKLLSDEPDPRRFADEFVRSHKTSIHVVCGLRGSVGGRIALSSLHSLAKPRLAIISERPYSYHRNAFVAAMRRVGIRLLYRNLLRRYGKDIGAFLTMGEMAMNQYEELNCARDSLFPFLYQCNRRALKQSLPAAEVPIRLVYVGSFDHRKGADLLLQLAQRLPENGWTLTFVGTGGEYQSSMQERVRQMPQRLFYDGAWQSDEVLAKLSEFDVAIVPSRHDGWGMVVNEALEAGLGAIVSANAGSFELIQASGAGAVVPSNDIDALTTVTAQAISDHKLVERWKKKAGEYAPRIRAEVIGQYLMDVLNYSFVDPTRPRPVAPWLHSFK